jgi:Deacetylase PdaC/Protein of unknown function (DUF3298)
MKGKIATVLSLVLTVILASGLQACQGERQEAAATPQSELKIRAIKNTEDLKELNAAIKTETARLDGGDGQAEKFNQTISDFVGKEVESFKSQARADKNENAGRPGPGFELDLSYEVKYSARDLISIVYSEYTFTGGAHGNTASESFNYDIARGEMLALADLFTPDSNYLKVISAYCIEALKKRELSDEAWIRGGAEAEKNNYSTWNIVPGGLLVTFDAYQVAAYADGPQEVVVPFSVLKEIIKPGGPLEKFTK